MPNTNNELSQPQQIVNPRLRVFGLSLFASSAAIVLWSILARIPVTSNGIGYIIPPGKLTTISARDAGKIYLLNHAESDELFFTIEQLEKINESLENLAGKQKVSTSLQVDSEYAAMTNDQINKLESMLDLTSKILMKAISAQNETHQQPIVDRNLANRTKQSVMSLQTQDSCFDKGKPIFNIIDTKRTDDVLSAVKQAKGSLFKLKTQLSWIKQYGNSRKAIASAYGSRAQAAEALVKKQILTQDRYLSLQGEYLGALDAISKLIEQSQSQFLSLVDSYEIVKSKFSSWNNQSLIRGDQSSTCVLQQITPNGSLVNSQDPIAIAAPTAFANFQQAPSRIPFFYKATEDRGIRNGDNVVIYPANVPKSTYGGIPGKVVESGMVLTDKNAALWVTGLSAIQPFSNSNTESTLYYGLVSLVNDDTPSGYKWTTGGGPSFKLLLGTSANVEVTVSKAPPISYLIPFLRQISGQ